MNDLKFEITVKTDEEMGWDDAETIVDYIEETIEEATNSTMRVDLKPINDYEIELMRFAVQIIQDAIHACKNDGDYPQTMTLPWMDKDTAEKMFKRAKYLGLDKIPTEFLEKIARK